MPPPARWPTCSRSTWLPITLWAWRQRRGATPWGRSGPTARRCSCYPLWVSVAAQCGISVGQPYEEAVAVAPGRLGAGSGCVFLAPKVSTGSFRGHCSQPACLRVFLASTGQPPHARRPTYSAHLLVHPLAGADPGAALRHEPMAHAGAGASAPLAAAVRLNLSRALCKAGRYQEAVELYGEMEFLSGVGRWKCCQVGTWRLCRVWGDGIPVRSGIRRNFCQV